MRALIVGAGGQVGRALIETAPPGVEIVVRGSGDLDVTDRDEVAAAVATLKPRLILNAAGYTAVDRAETDVARAHAVNADAVGFLSEAARAHQAQLVHVSTDFVFDGRAGRPYPPDAVPNPLGVYGRSKRAGELAAGDEALIVRTAWIYAAEGHNFARTMLRLMAERTEVRVVADQIGTPTCAASLAAALWALAAAGARGIHHYTDAGVASWYDFAVAIREEARAAGLLDHAATVLPVATADFRTPAERPPYSVLDKSATWAVLGQSAPHWRVNLRRMIARLASGG